MQSGFCSNCGEPLAPNAAFCPNCGKKVETPNPDQLATQLQPPPPPPAALNPTVRASAPPAGDFPPASGSAPTLQAPPPGSDPYASQYASGAPPSAFSQYGGAPPASGPQNQYIPPPVYAPGPPPPVTPGGVAPWAQPQKRQGRRNIFVVLLVALVLVAACGAGAYALLHRSPSKTSTRSSTPGTSQTPGTGATTTPGGGNTPVTSGGTQTLDNINRTGIYSGVVITILSATQSHTNEDFGVVDPDKDDILKINATISLDHSDFGYVDIFPQVMAPDGRIFGVGPGHKTPSDALPLKISDGGKISGAEYLEVPKIYKITDWTFLFGKPDELPMAIPLSGNYDPATYQEIPHTMGLNQPIKYHNGDITGVITKIITVTWNFGHQAPKGKRFVRVYFHVTNNTAFPVSVGDSIPPQYLLIYPNGDRQQADTRYNRPISVSVNGGESKDVGFDSWIIDPTPAPYQMVFLNPNGSTAGMVDFGTI